MTKDYEGKLGIGQLLFCIIALATLVIPYAIQPEIVFSFNNVLPIANSTINTMQSNYLAEFFTTLSFSLPDMIFTITTYLLYVFYGIVALTFLLTLLMMFLRNEPIRQILRALSVLVGFIMLAVFVLNLLTVAGFFTYYLNGKFGGNALIVDCLLNNGLLFFLGVTAISILAAIKHFSSFFGKTH